MANKSYYHRSFIILKAENRGYGFQPNKEPTGFCKFEIRRGMGKAYIYLQDIKPSSALGGVYEAYLISLDSSINPCRLASLHVDEQGRSEHITSFDADDIKGSGHSLESFHALAIVFRSGGEGRNMKVAYPLIGYSSRDININTHRITESLRTIYGEDIELESEAEIKKEPEPMAKPISTREDMEPGPEVESESTEQLESSQGIYQGPETELETTLKIDVEAEPGYESESVAEPQIESQEQVLESELIPEFEVEPESEFGLISEQGMESQESTLESEPVSVAESALESEPEAMIGLDAEFQSEKIPELGMESELQPNYGTGPEFEAEADPIGQPVPLQDIQWEFGSEAVPEPQLDPPPTHYGEGISQGEDQKSWEQEVAWEAPRTEEELRRAYEDSYQGYLEDYNYRNKFYPYGVTTYWDSVKDYFTGLFKAHERIDPFDNDLRDAQWIRVQQSFTGAGGFYGESPYRYPYYTNTYPDHYIVGLLGEEESIKYVIYGIPSMYSMIPPISINGFSQWAPIKGGYGMGYWLLYVDAINGMVVYPR